MKFLKFRILFLTMAFAAVIVTMHKLKNTHVDPTTQVTWCKTRVKALELSRNDEILSIEQTDLKWRQTIPQIQELNQVEMEKWLGRYCTVEAETLATAPNQRQLETKTSLRVSMIDGSSAHIQEILPEVYLYEGAILRSAQMSEAFEALRRLGAAQ